MENAGFFLIISYIEELGLIFIPKYAFFFVQKIFLS